jgi:ABC-type phosphate transport system permease subunit
MMTSEMPTVPAETKWATAFVLVVLVLGMNIGAILWRTQLRRAKRW